MIHFKAVLVCGFLFWVVLMGTMVVAQPATIEFDPGIEYAMNYPINHSQVNDVNGDGILDILSVVGEPGVDPLLLVMLGTGNGDFTPAITSPITVNFPWSLTVADFDEDGMADVVVA